MGLHWLKRQIFQKFRSFLRIFSKIVLYVKYFFVILQSVVKDLFDYKQHIFE